MADDAGAVRRYFQTSRMVDRKRGRSCPARRRFGSLSVAGLALLLTILIQFDVQEFRLAGYWTGWLFNRLLAG